METAPIQIKNKEERLGRALNHLEEIAINQSTQLIIFHNNKDNFY